MKDRSQTSPKDRAITDRAVGDRKRGQDRVIRASELGQYDYCARAWWLHTVQGAQPANAGELAAGEAVHRRHGRAVWLAAALRWAAIGLLVLAAALVVWAALG
ncbi:MAG: hypothetical protein RMN25_02675 [Anaerolineae bacterium]|nr:hypothetical protein [Thermoflexales bacterium]MDW8406662.1 hypothetical protein [Anaerolineae bacterium]